MNILRLPLVEAKRALTQPSSAFVPVVQSPPSLLLTISPLNKKYKVSSESPEVEAGQ